MNRRLVSTIVGSLVALSAGCTADGATLASTPARSGTSANAARVATPGSAGSIDAPASAPALRTEVYPVPAAPAASGEVSADDLRLMHGAYDRAFKAIADSFGMSRVAELRAHGPEQIVGVASYGGSSLPSVRLEGLELISLLDGSEHAYVDPDLARDAGRSFPRLLTPAGVPEGQQKVVTRAPDDFERDALARLRAGESVVISADRTRMLGAIRATERCSHCHVVETGDLLGAFSYSMAKRETPAQ